MRTRLLLSGPGQVFSILCLGKKLRTIDPKSAVLNKTVQRESDGQIDQWRSKAKEAKCQSIPLARARDLEKQRANQVGYWKFYAIDPRPLKGAACRKQKLAVVQIVS